MTVRICFAVAQDTGRGPTTTLEDALAMTATALECDDRRADGFVAAGLLEHPWRCFRTALTEYGWPRGVTPCVLPKMTINRNEE